MIKIMSSAFIASLAHIPARTLHFAAKEMVVDRGQAVDSLYIVRRGLVHLVRFQEDGRAVVLQRASAGAVIAEASVFALGYHCAAMAITACSLTAYPAKHVRAHLEHSPESALAYAHHLAGEVREARKRAEILALKKVSERLEAWLVWNDGKLPQRGQWHHVAEDIGVSREALYRELSKRR